MLSHTSTNFFVDENTDEWREVSPLEILEHYDEVTEEFNLPEGIIWYKYIYGKMVKIHPTYSDEDVTYHRELEVHRRSIKIVKRKRQ
jgi:hypothetical protein